MSNAARDRALQDATNALLVLLFCGFAFFSAKALHVFSCLSDNNTSNSNNSNNSNNNHASNSGNDNNNDDNNNNNGNNNIGCSSEAGAPPCSR